MPSGTSPVARNIRAKSPSRGQRPAAVGVAALLGRHPGDVDVVLEEGRDAGEEAAPRVARLGAGPVVRDVRDRVEVGLEPLGAGDRGVDDLGDRHLALLDGGDQTDRVEVSEGVVGEGVHSRHAANLASGQKRVGSPKRKTASSTQQGDQRERADRVRRGTRRGGRARRPPRAISAARQQALIGNEHRRDAEQPRKDQADRPEHLGDTEQPDRAPGRSRSAQPSPPSTSRSRGVVSLRTPVPRKIRARKPARIQSQVLGSTGQDLRGSRRRAGRRPRPG